jgi:hypothetical protein
MNSYCYHFINGLKGAASSEMMNQQQGQQMQQGQGQQQGQQTLSFESNQVSLIATTLKICRLFVEKNPQNFQQSQQQEILSKIDKSLEIISGKDNNNNKDNNNKSLQQQDQGQQEQNLKGASSSSRRNNNNVICPNTKIQNLKNLLNCFSLS